MRKRGLASILILAAALLGGCAGGPYVYRPAQATASLAGLPASRQPVPRNKPAGEIVVATSGITEIKNADQPSRALFVRVAVSNQSDEAAWAFDTRKQAVVIAGQSIPAAFVNAYDGYEGSTSVVRVARGQSRTVDFYFPLPANLQADEDVPPFDLSWNVETSREMVADRTVFQRVQVEPVYASSGPYPYGYYRPYGYDPFWPPYSVGLHVGYGVGYGYPGHFYGVPRGGPYYRGGGGVYFRGRRR